MERALEQLHKATLRLAQDGPVKDRLADAYQHYLADMQPQQLPEAYRVPFADMCRAMCSAIPLPRESPARASVRKMSSSDANRYAEFIVSLFAAIARENRLFASPASSSMAGLGTTGSRVAPVVQLFAAEG